MWNVGRIGGRRVAPRSGSCDEGEMEGGGGRSAAQRRLTCCTEWFPRACDPRPERTFDWRSSWRCGRIRGKTTILPCNVRIGPPATLNTVHTSQPESDYWWSSSHVASSNVRRSAGSAAQRCQIPKNARRSFATRLFAFKRRIKGPGRSPCALQISPQVLRLSYS